MFHSSNDGKKMPNEKMAMYFLHCEKHLSMDWEKDFPLEILDLLVLFDSVANNQIC
jgi:hypothetical protein